MIIIILLFVLPNSLQKFVISSLFLFFFSKPITGTDTKFVFQNSTENICKCYKIDKGFLYLNYADYFTIINFILGFEIIRFIF